MSIRKISATAACLIAISNYSANAYSALPESCFKTKFDYEIYLEYEFNTPWDQGFYHGVTKMNWLHKAYNHGPAQRKTITINTKEVSISGKLYLDASESTTPSSEKSYLWQAVNAKGFMDSSSKFLITPTGSEQLFNLTLFDPVCEDHLTQQLKIRVQ